MLQTLIQSGARPRQLAGIIALAGLLVPGVETASAQLTGAQLDALRLHGQQAGWTFSVGPNPATERPLEHLCGLIPPKPGEAPPGAGLSLGALRGDPLPSAFDWRTETGCPPVRDQGSCGSCWAFSTVGPLECNILIQDGDTVDLSEQWLVSCNDYGYGCDGGWYAHQYHLSATDVCDGTGAVSESDFPYSASDESCDCPYNHTYTIAQWSYVEDFSSVASTELIKQAIYNYGPVSAAVYVGDAFRAYDSGVFNASATGQVNHAIVLVGWDDNGGDGYWILRNSWGTGWGESGYMRISYNCAQVGYAACYVVYAGQDDSDIEVTPDDVDFGAVNVGSSVTRDFTVRNVGTDTLDGEVQAPRAPFSIVGTSEYSLAPGASTQITIKFEPELLGDFDRALVFTGGGSATSTMTGTGQGTASAGNTCSVAPTIRDGTYTVNNGSADTDDSAACAPSGVYDLWWRFVPEYSGEAVLDTHGSDIDTVLSVFDMCRGTELKCNDDSSGLTSSVTLDVTADQPYYVRVGSVVGTFGDVVLNVETTPPDPELSGYVIRSNGASVDGVLVAGFGDTSVTNGHGAFELTVSHGSSGTVTPTKAGWTFDPPSISLSSVTADRADLEFVGTPAMYTVSGQVLDADGLPVAGVVLDGFASDVITDANGQYAATVDHGFMATVVPTTDGLAFEPASRRYTAVEASLSGHDYLALPNLGALQVTLGPGEVVEQGAWRVADGEWQPSGAVLDGLVIGLHVIEYARVDGWTAPPRELVTIRTARTAELSRTYMPGSHKPTCFSGTSDDNGDPSTGGGTHDPDLLPPAPAPMFCGAGSLAVLPLVLVGVACGKLRRR